ncbi:poly [Aphis craccivora]|uniref:Poly n=1 Tax=Aphis craccivora TaxID=307492 RepID=A0A6G0Z076_APHCR|nr:poly [Aphis craccivora]
MLALMYQILKVQKINNPQTYGMYLLHKEELELDCDITQKILQKTILTGERQSKIDLKVVLVFNHVRIIRIDMLNLRKSL